jgi:hypothetical protein
LPEAAVVVAARLRVLQAAVLSPYQKIPPPANLRAVDGLVVAVALQACLL